MATFSDVQIMEYEGLPRRRMILGEIVVSASHYVDGRYLSFYGSGTADDGPVVKEMIEDQLRWLKEQEGGGSGDVQ